MPKVLFNVIGIVTIGLFLAGCGAQTRAYIEDQERVDQEMDGNAGYLMGTPQQPDRSTIKRTRKTIVVETTLPTKELEGVEGTESSSMVTTTEDGYQRTESYESTTTRRDYDEPVVDQRRRAAYDYSPPENYAEPQEVASASYTEYTVLENDTLQKISKKFYNSYSKWQRIYDANKEVIKDPNFIKPGTVLRIPQN